MDWEAIGAFVIVAATIVLLGWPMLIVFKIIYGG
jgi:hypothetical protein